MGFRFLLCFFFFCILVGGFGKGALGLSCNWGTRSSHPLPPNIVVKLMKENGFTKVKLFEADAPALEALGKSNIEVMVGIPNDLLAPLASNVQAAVNWVSQNVSYYISKYGTNIRHVAVGNEPFLKDYKDRFVNTTFPALQNIQAALIKAGLGRDVKVTVPLNADVYESDNDLPSNGNFRPDLHDLMMSIIKFLSDNGGPLTVNIYPFLSLYADANFPSEFAFFNGNAAPVVDGSISYTNVFDANFDTLISALEKNGFGSMPVIVGEVGWPTDGDPNANLQYAQRFNQGLLKRILQNQGTPKRKNAPEVYFFALIDEDMKSVEPGKFERHWGIFNYDGTIKYNLNVGNGRNLVAAKGVRYLARQWCVMSPAASITDPQLSQNIDSACTYADCTSLGYGSSCGMLDAKSNVSYAFNAYYQTLDQRKDACSFNNMSVLTTLNPSQGTCLFKIMIDLGKHEKKVSSAGREQNLVMAVTLIFGLILMLCGFY
ncbi:hypothetical protein HS088_TW23G00862 [Tripterygium wilfordii]|uniref:glucan endo-1,3-beta-D-glucosidase n=1 Tax=Tripterygium wilfordii TaxID=458696 RepID=A0A7J7BW68_TRIWF|nr:glucan endo-1,3-beta-glucosidase 5 [Tripterygium wilfordii]KAF5726121.1 hypothetical protein HS088_TW23G00862 [Tripterygium wilfordii]